tara:strand:- start:2588 stop:3361 length:774 start_codon:yes stop_codon:yes gene_type:complete
MKIVAPKMLRFVYNTLLLGMPQMLYNPLFNTPLHIPITINEQSTYINFKLSSEQVRYLNQYVQDFDESLELIPINLYENSKPGYFISINIYNSTSPVFMTQDNVIRCELNTYIMDNTGKKGTLILDYLSNGMSMDPVTIWQPEEFLKKVHFESNDDKISILCKSHLSEIYLNATLDNFTILDDRLSLNLIEFTDNIYYKNGILDKLFYDTSLINPTLLKPEESDVTFIYKNCVFGNVDSIFVFKDNIRFVGSMWENL